MNYKVLKNKTELKTKSCVIYPKPYNHQDTMEYVMFAVQGHTDIIIESKIDIKSAVIRPLSKNVDFEIGGGKIFLSVSEPIKLSVEINGSCENNLMIFAYEAIDFEPEKNGNYIVIKKDEKNTGTLTVDKDNTTVYIEEDAVLNGNIIAKDCNNLTICGLGRVCMEQYTYEMRKDFARSVDIINCKNVKIRDIIIDDSNDWSMRINGCDNVDITNIKIFGCRGNSDGIDVCGSRNVTVSDIFTRVWDDSFVVKALGTGNAENILFKDSVLWNDFARPIEVGVELRADKVKNIRFENIDIIHSSTGYPLMGIHHGDHAEVSDIVFNNIRIEDTPGAQLFDIRIADSVWNRDDRMGNIRNITFSNIDYIGSEDSDVMLSNSRIEGFSELHDIRDVNFNNIKIKGKAVKTIKELGLDIHEYVKNISVTSDLDLEEAAVLSCEISAEDEFKFNEKGVYTGNVTVELKNNTERHIEGTAYFSISPKNMAKEKEFDYSLSPGECVQYKFYVELQPGKYVFYLKNYKNEIENKFLYTELCMPLIYGADIKESPLYKFINYYNNDSISVKISAEDDNLILMNASGKDAEFVLYTALPVPECEGEVIFSAEETDFGEVCAFIKKGDKIVPAPQLRCPAEITYVFKNEPKVKEIYINRISFNSNEIKRIPFNKLGIDKGTENFIMEIEAKTDEISGLRYPYTLFHSTMPEKTAHMYGNIQIIRKRA